ncbi:MAG: transcription-repair coupling factor [Bacteroidales bacterium]|nr:MAG: transcription-repair coupling factor [Bacteroidales bacterium]
MNINDFQSIYTQHPQFDHIGKWLKGNQQHLSLHGLNGSANAFVIANIFQQSCNHIIVSTDDVDSASYLYFDLTQLLNSEQLGFMPSLYKQTHKGGVKIIENQILRTDSLNKLSGDKPTIIVTYPEALSERVESPEGFASNKIVLQKGDEVDMNLFVEQLQDYGFQEVDFVYEVGQYSQRGSILDVFSYSNEYPYRIDFWGDNIDSIRTFDIERQLSIEPMDKITIIANRDNNGDSQTISLLDFVPRNTLLVINDVNYCLNRVDYVCLQTEDKHSAERVSKIVVGVDELRAKLRDFRTIELLRNYFDSEVIEFSTSIQPNFDKNFDLISNQLKDFIGKGYKIFISSNSVKQTDRISSIFVDRGDDIPFLPLQNTIHEGFIDHLLKLCLLTEHQIFNRFHKFSLKSDSAKRGKAAMLLKEINQLKIGDLVVHHDHGIGQFSGLLKTEINGRQQEVIKLIYRGGDIVFVNISSLHKISKYRGKESVSPSLSKLGTGAWERLKERTKNKVKDIARDLIKLYSQRLSQKGFEYSPDGYLQTELEASFLYEDTPDQAKATADIKADMESSKPMDRLVCGDVGFGKTEVAMRAAFKAVTDGKQVAVLVPTTILAFQHYKTFSERFKNFPVEIEYISRAKSPKQTKDIAERVKNHKIDILIGTHKIASNNISFDDLGLLIIDEEQKFGVSIKEKLKALKINVDTLTLTATPIPRTLQFSLMGARDLSIINTPPPNRYPVITELIEFEEEIIRDAIQTEIDRNGQVFFINNKVQNIKLFATKIQNIVPAARIAIAHGQMPTGELENTIIDFMNYEYDILIATSVVESGIDMPNVNTIIINKANHFGLSDLHQLRGRVGRSNRKAYCYLITPPFKDISEESRRRLQAISTFSELGSGFNIAMQDLDIRGAGNMLGAEQSGFIAELGYETYQKILNEAVEELHQEEFPEIQAGKDNALKTIFVSECSFDSDFELVIPSNYVASTSERIALYRELDAIDNVEKLLLFKERLKDRFGEIPPLAEDLMKVLPLRWEAMSLGIEKILIKKGKMTLYLVSKLSSPYYQSREFGKIISYMGQYPQNCELGEINNKRFCAIKQIDDLEAALNVLSQIKKMELNP